MLLKLSLYVCVCTVLSVCWAIQIVRIQWLTKEHQEARELQKDDLHHICRFIYTYTHAALTYKCTQTKTNSHCLLCINVFQAFDYEKKKLQATKGEHRLDLLIYHPNVKMDII